VFYFGGIGGSTSISLIFKGFVAPPNEKQKGEIPPKLGEQGKTLMKQKYELNSFLEWLFTQNNSYLG